MRLKDNIWLVCPYKEQNLTIVYRKRLATKYIKNSGQVIGQLENSV